MLGRIFNRTSLLERAADVSLAKNEVISQNISNIDTPGYKRKKVLFSDILKSKKVDIDIVEDKTSQSTRIDGNNVDIEKEMADMAKNSIRYNVLIQSIQGKIRNIKSVISEGRR